MPAKDFRREFVLLRVNATEKRLLETVAEAQQRPVSTWVRNVAIAAAIGEDRATHDPDYCAMRDALLRFLDAMEARHQREKR